MAHSLFCEISRILQKEVYQSRPRATLNEVDKYVGGERRGSGGAGEQEGEGSGGGDQEEVSRGGVGGEDGGRREGGERCEGWVGVVWCGVCTEMKHRHDDHFVILRNDLIRNTSLMNHQMQHVMDMTARATLKMTGAELTRRQSERTVTHINAFPRGDLKFLRFLLGLVRLYTHNTI